MTGNGQTYLVTRPASRRLQLIRAKLPRLENQANRDTYERYRRYNCGNYRKRVMQNPALTSERTAVRNV